MDLNWILLVTLPDGRIQEFPPGTEWKATSRFGKVEDVVVINADGSPAFNRPRYHEAPNTNMVAWGHDPKTGDVRIAMLTEERPHALHPSDSSLNEALKFGQVPMGFKDKIIGKDLIEEYESAIQGAIRELGEETGARTIISVYEPTFPFHNPNPTFVATWSELVFVQVNLEKIEEKKLGKNEMIYKAEYLTIPELLNRIRQGQTQDGAIYRACTSLSILMIFFATFPHLWLKD
jgi:hypothetical protein